MSDVLDKVCAGPRTVAADGLRGLVGAGPRLRDLRHRPGLGAARADRRRPWPASGPRPVAWATGLGAASSSCSYAAIAIAKSALPEGRLGGHRARLPVRLDQPGLGARPRPLGADRLAVHARRVPRRHPDDRADGGAAAPLRLRRALEEQAREHAQEADARPRRTTAARRRAASSADVAAQLPRRLDDALQGDRDRLPARRLHRPARRRLLQRPLPHRRAAAG